MSTSPNLLSDQNHGRTELLKFIVMLLTNTGPVAQGGSGLAALLSPTSAVFSTVKDIVCTVAGTAKQGLSQGTVRGALVTAFPGNAGNVYIGGKGVSNGGSDQKGLILSPLGMPSQFLIVQNVDQIWVNADNANDGVGVIIF